MKKLLLFTTAAFLGCAAIAQAGEMNKHEHPNQRSDYQEQRQIESPLAIPMHIARGTVQLINGSLGQPNSPCWIYNERRHQTVWACD